MSNSLQPHGLQHAMPPCPSLSLSLLKFMFIESVVVSNHFILCLSLPLLPAVFPSIRIFSSELVFCIRGPKYWSLRFSISPSNEYTGLISFRTDWLDLLAVQGSLESSFLLSGTYTKIGIMQRRLAWLLCKDDMQIHEVIHIKKKKSSSAPQFKSINSLVLNLLHGAVLTCVHYYWKNHNSVYRDPC